MAFGDVPSIDPATGRIPDEFAPPIVEVNRAAAAAATAAALDASAPKVHTHAIADVVSLSTALTARELVANKSDSSTLGSSTSLYPTQRAVKVYVDTIAATKATLGADGKIPSNLLPTLSVVDVTPVSSQAAMLALDADKGDVAIRTDTNQTFILSANTPTVLSAWKEMVTPADGVLTVNGRTGPNISGLAEQTDLQALTDSVELWANKTNNPALGDSTIRYPTESAVKQHVLTLRNDVTTLLADKAPLTHTHTTANITGLDTALTAREVTSNKSTSVTLGTSATLYPSQGAVKSYVDNQVSTRATTSHTHTTANITGLDTQLAGFAPMSHTHSTANITGLDGQLANFAPLAHSHSTANITGLESQLANLAPLTHTHSTSAITGLDDTLATLSGKEVVANKSDDASLGTSVTLYPTQRAVKSYADTKLVGLGMRMTSTITTTGGIMPDPTTYYEYEITALTTSFTVSNPVAPPAGTAFQIVIKDDGTTRALNWGSGFYGLVAPLPTTTPTGKILVLVFRYSAARLRWELMTLRQEV